jgi:WD40 repeat protein
VIIKENEIVGHAGAIYTCTAYQHFLFTAGADKIVALWDLNNSIQEKFSIKLTSSCYSLKLISDNLLAIGLSNGDLYLIDVNLKQEVKFFTQHKTSIFSIQTNIQKNHFYSADTDGNLAVWDLNNLTLLLILPLNCGKIRRIEVDKIGENIVLSCQDGFVKIFETQFYNEIYSSKKHNEGATSAVFHPSNQEVIISGGKDAFLKIYNWKNNELIKQIPAHNFAIYDVLAFEEHKVFVTASRDKSLKMWSLIDYSFISKLERKNGGHSHSINDLERINNEKFVSVGDDKRIITWNFNLLAK